MGKGKHGKIERKFNKNIKYVIVILIILIIVVIGILYALKNIKSIDLLELSHQEEESEITITENKSEELKKEKEFLGLKFQNNSMRRENGVTYFTTEISNESNKKFEGKDVKLIFQSEDLSIMADIETRIDGIEAGKMINFELSTSLDLINSYTFKVQ